MPAHQDGDPQQLPLYPEKKLKAVAAEDRIKHPDTEPAFEIGETTPNDRQIGPSLTSEGWCGYSAPIERQPYDSLCASYMGDGGTRHPTRCADFWNVSECLNES